MSFNILKQRYYDGIKSVHSCKTILLEINYLGLLNLCELKTYSKFLNPVICFNLRSHKSGDKRIDLFSLCLQKLDRDLEKFG